MTNTLEARINEDLKQAMRDKNEIAKLTLRAVKTSIIEFVKSGTDDALDDERVLTIIQKEAKRRRDAAAEYDKVGAEGHAAQEREELAVLEAYLPSQLSDAEIEVIAKKVLAETGATSMKEMGKVMPKMMAAVGGQADGRAVNQVIRRLLNS